MATGHVGHGDQGANYYVSDTGQKMLKGEQASEESLSAIGSKLGGVGDFETWKTQHIDEYSNAFEDGISQEEIDELMLGAYEVAGIMKQAFPGIEKLSNEERSQLVGDLTMAAVNGSDRELASAVQALGGTSDLSLDDYRQLGASITNNHEALHENTKAPQPGRDLLFLVSHMGYTNLDTGLSGMNANGNTIQPGQKKALEQA
jgi:hypothetical protein